MPNRAGWEAIRARLAHEQTVVVSILAAYAISGKLGLMLATVHPAASLVWPPAGIALGAFLVFGFRIWALLLGAAVIVYVTTLGITPASLTMAAGDLGQALAAAYLVNRFAGGRHALHTPRNCLRFAGIVLLVSVVGASNIGALSLIGFRLAPGTDYAEIWATLQLGNFAGAILIAPLLILGSQGSTARMRTARFVEGVAAMLAVLTVALLVFYGFTPALRAMPLDFLIVPVLLWVAFRLGRRATAGALLMLAVVAISGTLAGYGPFARTPGSSPLMAVQMFLAMTVVMTLALAAMASEYLVAEEQLREMVVTDPLTGLPNYRKLLEVLGTEIKRANGTDRPFAVVFFDMDGLKRINDEMGHLIGSRAVCRFAEMLRAACRTTDTAARYGGDEFVAVLSDTDLDGARLVITRVNERLTQDPDKPELAVSAGIAMYPRDGRTPTTLLSAADRALYGVKAEKAAARRRGVVGFRERTVVNSR